MACERYREALSDVAAGTAASADVEAHLVLCADCRAELAALRQALAVSDEELDRLLRVEPSPELAARIRTALSESAAEPGWRPGWRFSLAAAVAALVLAAGFVALRHSPVQPPALVTDRGPTPVTPTPEIVAPLSRPPVERPSEPGSSSAVASHRVGGLRGAPAQRAPEPEVLVQAGEAEALLRFAASLRRRTVASDSLLVADHSSPLAEPKDVEIRPLAIVPLDPEEGSGAE